MTRRELRLWFPGEVLTKNEVRSSQWRQTAATVKMWRTLGQHQARRVGMPRPLGTPARVVAYQVVRERTASGKRRRGKLPDVGACSPTVEAIIDGFQDYGAFPDDSQKYVYEKRYTRNKWGKRSGIVVVISWGKRTN